MYRPVRPRPVRSAARTLARPHVRPLAPDGERPRSGRLLTSSRSTVAAAEPPARYASRIARTAPALWPAASSDTIAAPPRWTRTSDPRSSPSSRIRRPLTVAVPLQSLTRPRPTRRRSSSSMIAPSGTSSLTMLWSTSSTTSMSPSASWGRSRSRTTTPPDARTSKRFVVVAVAGPFHHLVVRSDLLWLIGGTGRNRDLIHGVGPSRVVDVASVQDTSS